MTRKLPLLVAAAVASLLVGVPSVAADHAAATPECQGRMKVRYGLERIMIHFKVDLATCWAEGRPYALSGRLRRYETPVARPQVNDGKTRCLGGELCTVNVVLKHPREETASYRATIGYKASPGRSVSRDREMFCTSHGAGIAKCDHPSDHLNDVQGLP